MAMLYVPLVQCNDHVDEENIRSQFFPIGHLEP